MISKKNILFGCILIAFFIYGIAIGRYQIFPYQQLRYIQDWVTNTKTENKGLENVEVVETSLQRLLIKEFPIEKDFSSDLYRTGGAIASLDSFLYISTNRNDQDKEKLVVLNTSSFSRVDINDLSVPMNYEDLLNSSLMKKEVPLFLFRVTGLYVEKTGINEHTLFVSHNEFHPDKGCMTFSLSRVSIDFLGSSKGIPREWDTIFRASPCVLPVEETPGSISFNGRMSGGPIINYDKDHLLVSVGSFHSTGSTGKALSMDTTSTFGKLILVDKLSGQHSIFAKGFRNTQGVFKDAYNNIWATDHGPQGGDELNLIERGKNYGWPRATYGIKYGNLPWLLNKNQGRHDRFTKPVYAWMPSIGISKVLRFNEFNSFPLWKGDLLVGSMNDKSLHRVRLAENFNAVYSERIEINHRIRDLAVLGDESIAILADGGMLLIIDDGGPVYEQMGPEEKARIAALGRYDQFLNEYLAGFKKHLASAESIFARKCSSCHYLKPVNGAGPHLYGLFSRKIGSIDSFDYSAALASSNEAWSPELLKDFLERKGPQFSNTSMPEVNLTASEMDSIIQYLATKKKETKRTTTLNFNK